MRTFSRIALVAIVALTIGVVTRGQSFEQTIPAGFMNTNGNTATSLPFNSTSDSVYQWAYDTSHFAHTGPMLINELYIRLDTAALVSSTLTVTDLEITLIESSNDVGSLSTTFANNIQRAEVVRSGFYLKNAQTEPAFGTACWLPLRLQKSFLYDPSTGNDLIIQLRSCGITTVFGVVDAQGGAGVARLGHTTNCAATDASFGPQTLAPVVKIDYTPVLEQTLPNGQMAGNSNSGTSLQ